jgi:hypothetical protein
LAALRVVRASESVQVVVGVGTAGLGVGNGVVHTTLFAIDLSQVTVGTARLLGGVVLVSTTTSGGLGVDEFTVAAGIRTGDGIGMLATTAILKGAVVGRVATAGGATG